MRLPGVVADEMAAAPGPASVDHVVDMVGSPTLDALLRCVRPDGRAVVSGAGRLTPTLGPSPPLADAAEAHRLVEARQAVGKAVLTCR